jgi:hypothetical protein
MTDYADRLAEMDEAYENVSDGRPEEGTYQALIQRFDFFESKKSGDLFLKTELKIVHDTNFDGAYVEAIHNLTDPERIRWTKRYLGTLGYDGPISQLMVNLESFIGLPVEIAVKYSDRTDDFGERFQNIFINRRLGEVTPPSDVPSDTSAFHTTPVDMDDVPFAWIPVDCKPATTEQLNLFA